MESSYLTSHPVISVSSSNILAKSYQNDSEINLKINHIFKDFSKVLVARDYEKFRVFDLGGSGLKTALLSYDKNFRSIDWVEPQTLLGKCPDNAEVDKWIRSCMQESIKKDLDVEINLGYSFGFSLAGLDKLRDKALNSCDMSTLFKIPSDLIRCIDDGAAHLVASMNTLGPKLPKGPIWNFSIGSGVGFGFTDCNHNVRKLCDFYSFFGCWPWDSTEPYTGSEVWLSCGSKFGFDQIVADHGGFVNSNVFSEFASRWKSYLECSVLEFSKEQSKEWGSPAAVVFTGGHVDHYGSVLADKLREIGLEIPVFTGPKNAGLLGAGWNVVVNSFEKPPLIKAISAQDLNTIKQLLVQERDLRQHYNLGYTPLLRAVQTGNCDVVKFLLESGALVNEPDFTFQTPLILAVKINEIEIVKLLLTHGADIYATDSWGQNSRSLARESDHSGLKNLFATTAEMK
ncbi:MAG: ankyrin repeat domain-containing protein [Parachlamydiaceae bacterium]|nr:ankyrin repeat domain-containing protein [Parachlamydiaceae bacterium]